MLWLMSLPLSFHFSYIKTFCTGYGNFLIQFRVYVYSLIKFDNIKDILFHTLSVLLDRVYQAIINDLL